MPPLPALSVQTPDIGASLMSGMQQGIQLRQQAATMQAGQLAAGGDMAGAQSVALKSGSLQLAAQIGQLSTQQQQMVIQKNQNIAKLAMTVKNAAPQEKKQALAWAAGEAEREGLPQDQIQKLMQGINPEDPSSVDRAMNAVVASGANLEQLIGMQHNEATLALQKGSLARSDAALEESKRHNRVDEANTAASLTESRRKTDLMYGEGTTIDPDTVTKMARQALTGDTSVFQNLGRGAQGAKNMVAIRERMYQVGADMGLQPEDIAGRIAQFGGTKAGERTIGTRLGQISAAGAEIQPLAEAVRTASAAVPRDGFRPLTAAEIAGKEAINDPNLKELAIRIQGLKSAYVTLMQRGGKTTDAANSRADDLMSKIDSQESLNRAVDTMISEANLVKTAAPQGESEFLQSRIPGATKVGATPAGSAAPPASLLKSGVRTTFKNGQVWTLGPDGNPQQVQ